MGKKNIPECKSLYTNTNKITDPQQLANLFNDHFSSLAYKYTSTLPKYENNYSEYLGNKIQETMYVWPTCPMEVKNILINSKPKLSAGFDEIPLKLLKSSPDNIIMALSNIFNLSLSTGKVNSDFKIAKIIPLYKKGDASDINNYRPISLLSNISKILEKIMYRRVISFLNRHNFFFENQFSFRKKCSTSQAISLLINSITNSFNKNEKSLAIFLDLSKAFDTISIEILLKKLDHYGIRGLAYIWFKNYLLNRKQQVVCSGVLSSTINSSTMGFPQGSI